MICYTPGPWKQFAMAHLMDDGNLIFYFSETSNLPLATPSMCLLGREDTIDFKSFNQTQKTCIQSTNVG